MPKAFVCEVKAFRPPRLAHALGFDSPDPLHYSRFARLPIIEECISKGEMLVSESMLTESSDRDGSELAALGISSIFVFPLFAGSERIGVMALCDEKPRRFSGEDFQLARLWASQAAVTLANQRLAATNDDALLKQRRLNQQVRQDAEAKAMLLRELNHRVKNNLAGIVGLLSAGVPELSVQAQQWLDRAIERIETLARVHELFAGTSIKRLSQIRIADLITKTLEPILAIKPASVQIKLDVSSVDIPLSTDQAVTLAMVVNELVSNALQHGVGDRGMVRVCASHARLGWAMIQVIDDGTGGEARRTVGGGGAIVTLPASAARTGVGLQLVRGLVGRELHGSFSIQENAGGGMTAIVQFPIVVVAAEALPGIPSVGY
jgi:two-component sensor histidine kinase